MLHFAAMSRMSFAVFQRRATDACPVVLAGIPTTSQSTMTAQSRQSTLVPLTLNADPQQSPQQLSPTLSPPLNIQVRGYFYGRIQQ